ncbi:class I SAM-dependent methyltransferase [Marinicella meishanensis]|uniref:class I SAM-dependent methyltransferase n=1 Tax=Marinicella meishanensis TaxID=2873263 RepID=UPI001CBC64CF|nr:class I SAM-dependent methyltransferase [Marinicella sp. NBU2979]
MPQIAKFWNKMAPKYAKQPVPDQTVYEQKLKLTQAKMHPPMQVMEFGCGTGTTALIHAPFVQHIWATDVADEMIRIAQEKASAQHIENVTFERLAFDDMALKPASWDMVMGHSILHLMKNKDQVIKDVFQCLKPGGWFVTSTACMGDKLSFFKWIAPIGQFLGLLPVLNVFTRQNLRDAMQQAGFVIDHDWQPNNGHTLFLIAQKPPKSGDNDE